MYKSRIIKRTNAKLSRFIFHIEAIITLYFLHLAIKISPLCYTKNVTVNNKPAMHLRSFKEGLVHISTHCKAFVNWYEWLKQLIRRENDFSTFGFISVSNCSLGPRDPVRCRYCRLKSGPLFRKRREPSSP